MQYAIAFGVVAGVSGGVLLGYLVARTVYRVLAPRTNHRRLLVGCIVGGFLVSLPPFFFLSFVVGGNIGGGVGAFASERLGLGSAGVPLGLALGIAAILSVGASIGAAIGGVLGYAASIIGAKLAA